MMLGRSISKACSAPCFLNLRSRIGAHVCGGGIGTSPLVEVVGAPAGEWIRDVIALKDHRLQVVLNGEPSQELSLGQWSLKNRSTEGGISSQDDAKRSWDRNDRINELD
jgi:hypothetical protein